jgi:hypothetical protein
VTSSARGISRVPNTRPSRVEVPIDVRRQLVRMGKTVTVALLGLSSDNYEEAIAPGGRVLDKTLSKIVEGLLVIDGEVA